MSLTRKEALELFQENRNTSLQSNRYMNFPELSHDNVNPVNFVEYYKDSTKVILPQQGSGGGSGGQGSGSINSILADYAMADYAILTE